MRHVAVLLSALLLLTACPADPPPEVAGVQAHAIDVVTVDGDLADLVAAGTLIAASDADGPLGGGPPADFGGDGTITELWAHPADTDGDGTPELLWVGIRGDFFTTDPWTNGTFFGIDVDPGSGDGTVNLLGDGADLSDTAGFLDLDITESGIALSSNSALAGNGLDFVGGITDATCWGSDVCGFRGLGSDGVSGDPANFWWFGGLGDVAHGLGNAALPPAPGAA